MATSEKADLPKNAEQMSISLENILPSLAKSLYGDDWRVSIRELLQNAHDALVERPNHADARIDVVPDFDNNTLTFRDNGIGMTLDEVKQYLATVGYGRKREQIENLKRSGSEREALKNVIGQYGIGFLSSFIIASRVEVVSKSTVSPNSKGVRAVFTGETKWYHEDCACPPGSSVTLTLRTDPIVDPLTGQRRTLRELLAFAHLLEEVRRFGDLLPFPIWIHRGPGDRAPEPANATKGEWEKDTWSQDKLFAFLTARRPNENTPLWAEPFKLDISEDGVTGHGFLYIPNPPADQVPNNQPVSRVELFCRRMFISDDIVAVLPDWASFVCAVVECPDLTPTLDRNNVVRHNEAFVSLRQRLGERIIRALINMASQNPANFVRVRNTHSERLYVALLESWHKAKGGTEPDSFFGKFIKYLTFTVVDRNRPAGKEMTIPQLIEEVNKTEGAGLGGSRHRPTIYYLRDPHVWPQYRSMILQKGYPVIVPDTNAEPALINAYTQTFPGEAIFDDVRDNIDLYVEKVDQTDYEQIKQYLKQLDGAGPDEVHVSRFQPSSVPAIMTLGATKREGQAQALQHLLEQSASVLDARTRREIEKLMETARTGRESVTVTLNAGNPVIDKLRYVCKTGGLPEGGIAAGILHEIYHNARGLIDPPSASSEHYFEHRTNLMKESLELDSRMKAIEAEYEVTKKTLSEFEREKKTHTDQPEEIMCAMLLTDLRGSTNMVGILEGAASAGVLQQYAAELANLVTKHHGRVEKFTGDGLFAWFDGGPNAGKQSGLDFRRTLASAAAACAVEVDRFTTEFFGGKVAHALLDAGVVVQGARTVLHFGKAWHGGYAGSDCLVGKQVVFLFRAISKQDLFDTSSIVMTYPFKTNLGALPEPRLLATDVLLDERLAIRTSFFAHPMFRNVAADLPRR